MDFALNVEEKKMLLRAARDAIRADFGEKTFVPGMVSPALSTPCGAFVTLEANHKLRGCIGYVTSDQPLYSTVVDAAKAAAFQDSRFPPLGREELPRVDIEISVLSPLEKIRDTRDIQVGRHGIFLRKGYQSGLLLPQVATEYGWDPETFLENTCRKAGLPGGCWKDEDTRIEIFTATVFSEREIGSNEEQ
jgi:AmmeMemoRadiSam system protein A